MTSSLANSSATSENEPRQLYRHQAFELVHPIKVDLALQLTRIVWRQICQVSFGDQFKVCMAIHLARFVMENGHGYAQFCYGKLIHGRSHRVTLHPYPNLNLLNKLDQSRGVSPFFDADALFPFQWTRRKALSPLQATPLNFHTG